MTTPLKRKKVFPDKIFCIKGVCSCNGIKPQKGNEHDDDIKKKIALAAAGLVLGVWMIYYYLIFFLLYNILYSYKTRYSMPNLTYAIRKSIRVFHTHQLIYCLDLICIENVAAKFSIK